MIISHSKKFIFFCNGKTGTTSLEAALAQYQDGHIYCNGVEGYYVGKHIPPQILRGQLGETIWNSYFKFCFVRNPYDLLVSEYRYNQRVVGEAWRKIFRAPRSHWNLISKFRLPPLIDGKLDVRHVDAIYKRLSMHRLVASQPSRFQHTYLVSADGERLMDYVGRFETLAESVAEVSNALGLEIPVMHLNSTEHRHYSSCYTPAAKERLEQLYASDFELCGYTFEEW